MKSVVQITGLMVPLIALLLGCQGGGADSGKAGSAQPKQEATQPTAPTGDSYSVRGKVVAADTDRGELTVRHETIHNFIGPTGAAEEMHTMEMTFPVVDAVDLSAFEAGSAVRFTLVVNWQARKTAVITELEGLPAETELDFSGGH